MTWGQIKKAINSTLGTKDFKPLNEIFSIGIQKFKESISNGTLICGKSKVLSDDWIELEISGNYHQGMEKGIYIVYYDFTLTEQGGNQRKIKDCVLLSTDGNGCYIPYSTSYMVGFSLSESGVNVSVKGTETYNNGEISIEKIKVKKIM